MKIVFALKFKMEAEIQLLFSPSYQLTEWKEVVPFYDILKCVHCIICKLKKIKNNQILYKLVSGKRLTFLKDLKKMHLL